MSFQQVESETTGLRDDGQRATRNLRRGRRPANTEYDLLSRTCFAQAAARQKDQPLRERRDRECDALEQGDRSVRISADSDPAKSAADLTHRPEIKIGAEAIAGGVERG
jgi:hypothetical protein